MGVNVQRPQGKPRRSGASYHLRQIYDRKKREHLAAYGMLICHLCGDLIDLDLPSRDDLSLSWDHVLPVSTHPHLAESPNNLAPAHFACNRVRQDTPLDEITGTPARIEAFKKLVVANRERTQARKDLKAANQELVKTPQQRGQDFGRTATGSSRHWCGASIGLDSSRHEAWCDADCPRINDKRVYDQRTGRYVA